MQDSLRVSPRYLGRMLLDNFCERCFFYLILLRFRLPFDTPMPGLMFHLDLFEKRYVDEFLAMYWKLPPGMEKLQCTESIEFPRKLTAEYPDYGLTLVGMPDAVLKRRDGKLVVVDYKTALCKGDDDPFLPAYKIQLLGYAELIHQAGIGEVGEAAIVYFENQSKAFREEPLDLATDNGFSIPFEITTVPVKLDRKQLRPLMKRFREIANLQLPPKGREGCRDCARLQLLLDAEVNRRSSEEYARNRDSLARMTSRQLAAERELALRGWNADEEDLITPDLCLTDSLPGPSDL